MEFSTPRPQGTHVQLLDTIMLEIELGPQGTRELWGAGWQMMGRAK